MTHERTDEDVVRGLLDAAWLEHKASCDRDAECPSGLRPELWEPALDRLITERDELRKLYARLRAALGELRRAASNFVEWCNSDEGLEAAEAFPTLESHQVTFENRLTTPEESSP